MNMKKFKRLSQPEEKLPAFIKPEKHGAGTKIKSSKCLMRV